MHNAIHYALSKIKFLIPEEVLDLAFKDRKKYKVSLDQAIEHHIMTAMVMMDCNLYGGKEVEIPLQPEWLEKTESTAYGLTTLHGNYGIYRIPHHARHGRPIVEVCHILPPTHMAAAMHLGTGSTSLVRAASGVVNSHTGGDATPRPLGEVIQGDMIRLIPPTLTHVNWVLTCRVAYDKNMTNLNSSSIEAFGEMCVLAAKTYAYTKLIVKVDRAHIEGGVEIASIRHIIDEYKSAERDYHDAKDRFIAGSYMDIKRFSTIASYMM